MLFVAPTKAVADRAENILKRQNLSMPVIVTNDASAIEDVHRYGNPQVIISRGGIAKKLREIENSTIVEIGISLNDVLQAVEELCSLGATHIGVVMRANILFDGVHDFTMGETRISIRPCKAYEEIERMIRKMDEEMSVNGIAGDIYAVHVAEKRGLLYSYVDSGMESIRRAIGEARRIIYAKQLDTLQAGRLSAILTNIREGVVFLDKAGGLLFYNERADSLFPNGIEKDFHKEMDVHMRAYRGEKLIDIHGNRVLFHMISMEQEHHSGNRVLIFERMETVMRSEQKIRSSLYQRGLYAKLHFTDILTQTPKMKNILAMAEEYAKTEANVLIYGETGTGKEGMAQSIHNASRRHNGPFVSVNCNSIPENLIESELFGYVEGAFTGARRSGKKGLFELADKGTIFLDEIGELPLGIQGRLLRVLQEHEVMRIGDDQIISLDIRVICATNRNLKSMVANGTFREDLFYRINVLRIHMPPLRERPDDIRLLLSFYYGKFAPKSDFEKRFPKQLLHRLETYEWPGNIRELRNLAEVFSCFGESSMDEEYLNELLQGRNPKTNHQKNSMLELPMGMPLKEIERAVIDQMLALYTPEEVCAKLGISRVTLWRKAK